MCVLVILQTAAKLSVLNNRNKRLAECCYPDKKTNFGCMGIIRQKVALQGCRFFAYHGYYPEEQKVGNHFIVDIETEMPAYAAESDELENTVNYERLFNIVSAEMKITSKLLETVAHRILKSILSDFPDLEIVKVGISKQNLPVKGEVKNSLVELTYSK